MIDFLKFKGLVHKILIPAYRAKRFDLDEQQIMSWYADFQEFPDLVVMQAFQNWVRTQAYPPTVAELRQEIGMLLQRRPQDYSSSTALPDIEKRESKLMPEHVRELIGNKIKNTTPAPTPKKQRLMNGDLREHLRVRGRQMIQEYCQRTYNIDGSMKGMDVVDEKILEIAGKKCRVLKYENGTEAVVGLTEVMGNY